MSDSDFQRFGTDVGLPAENKPRGCSRCGCVFFLLVFVTGSVTLWYSFISPLAHVWSAQSWAAVPCTILKSEVKTHPGSESDSHSLEIQYRYRVQSTDYVSDRYDFASVTAGNQARWQAISERYPVESEQTCYVNPQDPKEAVLNRELPPDMWLGLVPLVFVVIGGLGLLGLMGFFQRRGGEPIPSDRSFSSADLAPPRADAPPARSLDPPYRGSARSETRNEEDEGDEEDEEDEGDEDLDDEDLEAAGPVTLQSPHSPVGGFVGALLACLVWNGILSVFVVNLVRDWMQGRQEWMLALFLTPFVLIGLGLVLFVIHSFLGIFNPRPMVTVNRDRVRLGETLEVRWHFKGSTSAVRRLKVELVGEEVATYRRGTSTSTDRAVFVTLPVLDTTNFVEITNGQGEVTLPTDTMHSFESGSNQIAWSLKLRGEIRFWPDVTDSYSIRVLPLAASRSSQGTSRGKGD